MHNQPSTPAPQAADRPVAHQGSLEEQLAEQLQYRALTVLLQSLRTREELRYVLSMHLERLLPFTNGALYLIDRKDRHRLVPVVGWGLDQPSDDAPLPSCVAQHWEQTSTSDSLLPTVVPPVHHTQGVCAPLMAEGELLGALYAEQEATDTVASPPLSPDSVRRLFQVADCVVLPLHVMLMREQLRQQSGLDPLTGVANRMVMNEEIERNTAAAAAWGANASVVLMDLDHFTLLNLASGHDAGDHLLKTFVRFLQKQLDVNDRLLRLGGDEFVVVLPATNADEARRRVEEWLARWLYETAAGTGGHSFSTGIADTKGHGPAAKDLLRAAHKALSDAKAAGRSTVVVAPPFVAMAHEETSFLAKLGITPAMETRE